MSFRNIFPQDKDGTNYSAFLVFSLLALIPVIAAFVPRALAILPFVIAVVGFVSYRFEFRCWPEKSRAFLVIVGMIFALSLTSSLWAMDQNFAVERSLKVLSVLLPCAFGFSLVLVLRQAGRDFFLRVFPACVIVAGVLCAIDLYANGLIYYFVRNMAPHEGGFNFSLVNRNVNTVVLYMLAGVFAVKGLPVSRLKYIYGVLIVGILGVLLYRTDSQSAHVMVAMAALFWIAFPARSRWAWLGMTAAIVLYVSLAPWLVQFFYNQFASYVVGNEDWFARSYMSARLEIWDYVARRVTESPIYGFGLEATRHIEHFEAHLRYAETDYVLHPHNATMQIWIEFGAVGAAFLCGVLAFLMHKIRSIPRVSDRRFAMAVFMAMFFIANTAYGLWQGWWLGAICIICMYVAALSRGADEARDG